VGGGGVVEGWGGGGGGGEMGVGGRYDEVWGGGDEMRTGSTYHGLHANFKELTSLLLARGRGMALLWRHWEDRM